MVPAQETFRRRALKLKVDFDLRDALPDEGQKVGRLKRDMIRRAAQRRLRGPTERHAIVGESCLVTSRFYITSKISCTFSPRMVGCNSYRKAGPLSFRCPRRDDEQMPAVVYFRGDCASQKALSLDRGGHVCDERLRLNHAWGLGRRGAGEMRVTVNAFRHRRV